jgi:hypothetical protein
MFNLVLVNLTSDARAVAAHAHAEQRNVSPEALRALLANFCEIDPIENASGETEIRVNVRHEKYLLRTEQRKVILYDVNQRELPGQMLSVDEAMVELDGTGAAVRQQAIRQARSLTTAPFLTAADSTIPVRPEPQASRPRIVALVAFAVLLLAGIIWLALPDNFAARTPAGFVPVAGSELEQVQTSLVGVYLTGSEPGQHGVVIAGPGEMKLIELASVDAPRVVYASYRPGRIDAKLHLVTDQPGGAVAVAADGNSLVYCGETYQRIP